MRIALMTDMEGVAGEWVELEDMHYEQGITFLVEEANAAARYKSDRIVFCTWRAV